MHGVARYDYLVTMCRELGVLTPEDPYPGLGRRGRTGQCSCRCSCSTTTRSCPTAPRPRPTDSRVARDTQRRRDRRVPARGPTRTSRGTRGARRGCDQTRTRLDALDPALPTVLINHFPLVREPTTDAVLPGVRTVVRHHRDGRLAPALPRAVQRLRAPAHSRGRRTTTGSASRRCRSATRANGSGADCPIGFSGRSCRCRSTRREP